MFVGTKMLVAAVIAAAPIGTDNNADVMDYEPLIDQAVTNCKNARQKNVDTDLLWGLVHVESKYNLPKELRGLLLAAACSESGYNPLARGDYRKGRSQAIGLFQMWRWWERKSGYAVDRRNPIDAAEAYMKHIAKQLKKVRKRCKHRTAEKQWVAAWVTAIRYPKPGGRCNEKPKHLRILRRWHRNIRKKAKEIKASYIRALGP